MRPLGLAGSGLSLVMVLASACSTGGAATSSAVEETVFICERSQAIKVAFADKSAVLTANGARTDLAQQVAASGVAYAGEGHTLRGKGHELTWTDPEGGVHQCKDQKWLMAQPQISEPSPGLAGTSWKLVHFQSSDDAIGIVVPPAVERYRLDFMPDGVLAMQLDCNRGRGTWRADPARTGGSLALGPAAMTRAMCQLGAIDTRFAADALKVRSYTLRDGKLSLALEADAGIYLWEAVPTRSGE